VGECEFFYTLVCVCVRACMRVCVFFLRWGLGVGRGRESDKGLSYLSYTFFLLHVSLNSNCFSN
jgi:hypothetical protein